MPLTIPTQILHDPSTNCADPKCSTDIPTPYNHPTRPRFPPLIWNRPANLTLHDSMKMLDPPSPRSQCRVYPIPLRQQASPPQAKPSPATPPPDASRPNFAYRMSATMDADANAGRASPHSLFTHSGATSAPRTLASFAHDSGAPAKGPGMVFGVAGRRASRFDPMDPDGDEEEEGYGDLGSRHPLRRVAEEGVDEGISLPSIKALFGSGDVPGTPASHSGHASTLPPLAPSPSSSSSPSMSYRQHRYPSSASTFSTISENSNGWWAPEYERGGPSTSSSLPAFAPPVPQPRSHTFPFSSHYSDDREAKRRRSDQPISADPEEAARLRWQSQTRNASLPTTSGSISGPSGLSSLRNHMLPPPSISPLPRGSISHSFPTTDDRSPTVPRSASIVGGQLARSFSDLTAADRNSGTRSPSMGPPILPPPSIDRRPSLFPPAPLSQPMSSHAVSLPLPSDDKRATLPPILPPPPSSPFSNLLHPDTPRSTPSRRESVTRPASPDRPAVARRSSLTEIIKAKTGDDVALSSGRSPGTIQTDQTGEDEVMAAPKAQPRRSSADSAQSAKSMAGGTPLSSTSSGVVRKRGAQSETPDPPPAPPNQGGGGSSRQGAMDLLAEGATRVSEQEADGDGDGDDEDPDQSQEKGGGAGPKYICAYCLKTFSRPSSLRIHTYSHTGERPFQCPEPSCRRKFSVQSNLKRHSKVHQSSTGGSSSAGAAATPVAARAPSSTPSQPQSATARPIPPQTTIPPQEMYAPLLNHSPYTSPLPPHAPHPNYHHAHSPLGAPQTATAGTSPMRPFYPLEHSPVGPMAEHSRVIHPPPMQMPSYPQSHQAGYAHYGYTQSPPHALSYPSLPPQSHQHQNPILDDGHHYLPQMSADYQYYQQQHQQPLHPQYMQSQSAPLQPYDHSPQQYLHPSQFVSYQHYPAVPSERYLQPSPGSGSGSAPNSAYGGYAPHANGGRGSDGGDAKGDEIEEDG